MTQVTCPACHVTFTPTPKTKAKRRLVRIDLRKAQEHEHPDIRTDGTFYQVKFDGVIYIGRFDRQWYGLNFNVTSGGSGWLNHFQFDAPGWNSSSWQSVYEIIPRKRAKKKAVR